MSKELKVKEETAVATTAIGRGFEQQVEKEDLILPRVTLLQALSPEVIEGKENCRPGVIINNISLSILSQTFIPLFFWYEWVRFNPDDKKSEYFDPAFPPRALIWKTRNPTPEQRKMAEFGEDGRKPVALKTINFLCYFLGEAMPLVLSFSKTNYKIGKNFLNLAMLPMYNKMEKDKAKKDMFSFKFSLKAKQTESDGKVYFVFDVSRLGTANKEEYAEAESLFDTFRGKEIRIHDESAEEEPTEENTRPY